MKCFLQKIKEWFSVLFKKKEKTKDKDETFVAFWNSVFLDHAKLYSGLYSSLSKVSEGSAKKKRRVFSEWYKRTIYNIDDEMIKAECEKTIKSLSESEEGEHEHYADLLLSAAKQAGIIRDTNHEITLDEKTAPAYISWDGEDLYIDDKVEIIASAWYKDGIVLEQGYAKLTEASED